MPGIVVGLYCALVRQVGPSVSTSVTAAREMPEVANQQPENRAQGCAN